METTLNSPLRVVLLEDNSSDAELVLYELRQAGFLPQWERVETEEHYLVQLKQPLDLILADYNLPGFNALSALRLRNQCCSEVPFVIVSGSIGEELAVSAMKQGASDYLLKDRLARLGQAVRQALEQRRLRDEQQQAQAHIQNLLHELKLANADLKKRQRQLQALSRRMADVQEQEYRAVGRELHDEIGQMLTGLKLSLGMALQEPAASADKRLRQAMVYVDELVQRVRNLSLRLRPIMLDDLGLLATLEWHLKRYGEQANLNIAFSHRGLQQRFSTEVETTAYRIIQEALTNVARHAGNRQVQVEVWTDADRLQGSVQDDGHGFDVDAALNGFRSSGLSGMQERARLIGGIVTILSQPGSGTRVSFSLPLHAKAD